MAKTKLKMETILNELLVSFKPVFLCFFTVKILSVRFLPTPPVKLNKSTRIIFEYIFVLHMINFAFIMHE